MSNQSDLTTESQSAKIPNASRDVWQRVKNPITRKLMFRYCPQTHQAEFMERGVRVVVELPRA